MRSRIRPAIGLVAGEASGRQPRRGAAARRCASALPARVSSASPGRAWSAAGCEAWTASDALAVMGLAEILTHLPRLLRPAHANSSRGCSQRSRTPSSASMHRSSTCASRAQLKSRGMPTVQYVSPQVWAWRQGRVRTIGHSVDLVLCLLPFESRLLRRARRARRLRRASARGPDAAGSRPGAGARGARHCRAHAPVVAVLPGSRARRGRQARRAVRRDHRVACARAGRRSRSSRRWPTRARRRDRSSAALARACARRRRCGSWTAGRRKCMAAADAVLRRVRHRDARGGAGQAPDGRRLPRRAADRLAAARTSAGQDRVLLAAEPARRARAGARVLPGARCAPEVLGPAVLEQLERPDRAELDGGLRGTFTSTLRRDASARAADAILELLASRRSAGRMTRVDPASDARLAPARIDAGVDEAGRGPLAGPVVAAAVILDPGARDRGASPIPSC